MARQLRLRPGPLPRPGPARASASAAASRLDCVEEKAPGQLLLRHTGHGRDRGRGQARADRRMARPACSSRRRIQCPSAKPSSSPPPARRSAGPIGARSTRRPSPTLAAHAIQRRGRARRDRSGRGRRRDHGRRAPAGRPGDDRPHRRAARRPARHRRRHVDRPPVRLGPDGDRHRRQAGHRRPDGRRASPAASNRSAWCRRPRCGSAPIPSCWRCTTDVYMPMIGTAEVVAQALRRSAASARTNMRCGRSSAPPPPRPQAGSTTRSSRSPRRWRSRTRRPARSRCKEVTLAKDEGNRPDTTLEGLPALQPVMGPERDRSPPATPASSPTAPRPAW